MIQINGNNFYSISEINEYVSSIFTSIQAFSHIGLIGEVSNYKGPNRSGHVYFDLKDDKSVLKAVIFKYDYQNMDVELHNGDQILVVGKLAAYATGGIYQIIINKVIPYGEGQILKKREQLKKKLYEEGLFSIDHKKSIPEYPMKIAIITGLNSAASADLKHNILRRWPIAEIIEFNPLVQGKDAPKDIIKKLEEAEAIEPDVIILGRGGGSVEDLSAFDDEELVRKLYDCKIPTISAIGHEINQSFCDLVCDKYASTPTGAAEIAVPNIEEVDSDIKQLINDIKQQANSKIELYRKDVNNIKTSGNITNVKTILSNKKENANHLYETIKTSFISRIAIYKTQVEKYKALCDSYSPLNVMKQGYSITYKDQKIVRSAKDVKEGDKLTIKLIDGEIKVEVTK